MSGPVTAATPGTADRSGNTNSASTAYLRSISRELSGALISATLWRGRRNRSAAGSAPACPDRSAISRFGLPALRGGGAGRSLLDHHVDGGVPGGPVGRGRAQP